MLGRILLLFFVTCIQWLQSSILNPCINARTTRLKTWGPKCENMCNCKHDTDCDATGYCLYGCMSGWTRIVSNGSCSYSIRGSTLKRKSLQLPSRLRNSTKRHMLPRISSDHGNKILYRYSPIEACIIDNQGRFTKVWHVTTDPPVLVKVFKVSFDVSPEIEDKITCMFDVSSYPGYSVTKKLFQDSKGKLNSFSVDILEFVITDTLTISVKSRGPATSCSPARMAGFFLYGLPICPYRKWGLHCSFDCLCPCDVVECHPSTGSCLYRGFACPPRKYGPSCSYECSPACGGYQQQCHVLTGKCKECPHPNMTGPSCESALTPEELAFRAQCLNNVGIQEKVDLYNADLNYTEDDNKDIVNKIRSQKETVVFIIFVFLILFLLICCSYVQTLNYCAKRRLREHYEHLDKDRIQRSSMVTYTEFNKEFMEMYEHGRPSCYSAGRISLFLQPKQGNPYRTSCVL